MVDDDHRFVRDLGDARQYARYERLARQGLYGLVASQPPAHPSGQHDRRDRGARSFG